MIKPLSKISVVSLLSILAVVFVSKNVMLSYGYVKSCEVLEYSENEGEEKESEREEVQEELDLFTHLMSSLSLDSEPTKENIWVIEVIKNNRHSEVLTPPPDLV